MRRLRGSNEGFTLVEVLVVMIIMGILLGMAMFSIGSMRQRYSVEKQTKEIYMDLMGTRLRALQSTRDQFVSLQSGTTTYQVYADGLTVGADGTFSAATDSLISTYALLPSYTMTLSNPALTVIQFNPRGLVDPAQTVSIRINPTAGGEYDCIVVDQLRTGMGKWNDTTSSCDVK